MKDFFEYRSSLPVDRVPNYSVEVASSETARTRFKAEFRTALLRGMALTEAQLEERLLEGRAND